MFMTRTGWRLFGNLNKEDKEMDKKDEMMIVGQDSIINKIYTITTRSEERRVGKECRSRWSPYH